MALPHVSNRNISNQTEVVKMKMLPSHGKPVCSFKSIGDWRFDSLLEHRDTRWHKYLLLEAIPKMKLFANYSSIPEQKPTGYFHCNECTILEINMKAMALCMKNNCNHFDNFNNRLFSVQSRKNSNSTSLSREEISHNKRNDKYKLKGEYFIFYSVSCVKTYSEGLERRLSSYRLLLSWQMAWAWFPESTWRCPAAYNCSSRDTQWVPSSAYPRILHAQGACKLMQEHTHA